MSSPPGLPHFANVQLLMAYVANLELEVDRLRKQKQFILHEAGETIKRIRQASGSALSSGKGADALGDIDQASRDLGLLLHDLQEPPGYHPAHDQVIAIAFRPLVEQVFRWQQRLQGASAVALRLGLESEYLEWFPARLRHILDNLISNALKYKDSAKQESWVNIQLRTLPLHYELRISDNGIGFPADEQAEMFDLFFRAAPAQAAGLGVGLAVVKLLVERTEGTLRVDSGAGQGTTFVVTLPRYDVADYLT